ncbi:PREDICTED: uncharacterized protein LOC109466550 [Branchiostoma belcheri]|uniref:Uncharacterized protein LOC109466550 n=1 Tax=Branchiostoma belcheri TaxID=7741 RepID=A0A6P4YRL7_BRABE|nr:PREDICTED: uncharacterized protein LOC109466550 [Branchiostoma belcheri]
MWSSSSSKGGGTGAGGSGGARPPHDITSQQGLRQLYNSNVVHAEQLKRPLGNSTTMVGPFYHTGARVTLEDGSKYLVHKGDGYGVSSQTVVTDAKHMGDRWVPVGRGHDVKGSTVSDFVKAGGKNYSYGSDNCQHGAGRMMDLSEGRHPLDRLMNPRKK